MPSANPWDKILHAKKLIWTPSRWTKLVEIYEPILLDN